MIGRLRHRLHDARHAFMATAARHVEDLTIVVAPQNRGWILDAIAQEIATRAPGKVNVDYTSHPPPARSYLFMHYELFRLYRHRLRRGSTTVVWFTHPSYSDEQASSVLQALSNASWIASSCTPHAELLARAGVPRDRLRVVLPGADAAAFRPHQRGGGAIGFSSAYYERKRPDLIVEIVRTMPALPFKLIGRNWAGTAELAALQQLDNFTYLEDNYDTYPSFYDGIDVLVSPSALEGGPIPLLEAMMSNAVPVASDTGFARDLIRHGDNGFICATDAPAEAYQRSIRAALALPNDIRSTVEHLTWSRYAAEMLELLGLSHH